MTAQLPLVSVLMPSYRHERYVAEAIGSVLNQTYSNLELIVVDDNSPDRTAQIAEDSIRHDPRAKLLRNPSNLGITRTLNRALAASKGEWIAILASDDKYDSRYVQSQFSFALRHPEIALVHSDGYYIAESGKLGSSIYARSRLPPVEGDGAFEQLILGEARIVACTLFAQRKVFSQVGSFDEALVSEDFDFHLRALREFKIGFNPDRIFYAREAPGSLGKNPRLYANDGLRIIEKHRDRLGPQTEDAMVRKLMRNSEMGFYAKDVGFGLEQALKAFRMARATRRRLEIVVGTGSHAARYIAKAVIARLRESE